MSDTVNFDEGLKKLEAMVQELETGGLNLEDAIDLYERGIALSNRCRQALIKAEQRVQVLKPKAGQPEQETMPQGRAQAPVPASPAVDDDEWGGI